MVYTNHYKRVATLYSAFVKGEKANLEPLPLQYADYSIWQRSLLTPEILEEKGNYWKKKLTAYCLFNYHRISKGPLLEARKERLLLLT